MPQENIRIKLGSLKRGSEISINGFNIKKQGNLWVVSKGDFFRRSYTEDQLGRLVERLSPNVEETTSKIKNKAIKRSKRLTKELETKAVAQRSTVQRPVAQRPVSQVAVKKPFKRNRVLLEVIDLIVQATTYFAWFAFFFTDLMQQYVGNGALFVLIGLGAFALLFHVFYVRQLGKRHRILNAAVGFIDILLVVVALTLFYGPLTHNDLALDQVLPSLELAIAQIESITLVSFVTIKWILTLIINKK